VNQGVFHETLNLIAVWKLPVILVCENNQYSEMTPSWETTSTTETWRRAAAYGIEAGPVDGNDVEAMYAAVSTAAERARAGGGATYLEAKTYRLWGHMMGDPEVYRSKEEVAQAWQNEPIARLGRRLVELGAAEGDLKLLEGEADRIIADALAFAEQSPLPTPEAAFEDVF
jgi:pyruvate dehydrogenase E1 component alpha subunit